MAELTLITGGARSGKSSFAQTLAEECRGQHFFIATCPHLDEEMAERVLRHQNERQGRGWQTIEEEIDISPLFDTKIFTEPAVILLDCITLWINNLLFQAEAENDYIDDFIVRDLALELAGKMRESGHRCFVVTNEVGLGIVPDNALARKYRDLVGTANQTFGRLADEVIFMSCGIPLYLKKI